MNRQVAEGKISAEKVLRTDKVYVLAQQTQQDGEVSFGTLALVEDDGMMRLAETVMNESLGKVCGVIPVGILNRGVQPNEIVLIDGTPVVLLGLTSSGEHLNGKSGSVRSFNAKTECYVVLLENDRNYKNPVSVKREHVLPKSFQGDANAEKWLAGDAS
jgi:hypothetical protein